VLLIGLTAKPCGALIVLVQGRELSTARGKPAKKRRRTARSSGGVQQVFEGTWDAGKINNVVSVS